MNTTSLDATGLRGSRPRAAVTRALAVLPLAGLALGIVTFYCIQAWARKTPWVFTDELEWTQLSRSIEEHGEAARRGEPIYFKSLYAFLIAPFWAIHDTATAYTAIKYANAVVMALAAVPTYLLARMLVPKRAALVVAVLAVCIPGMSYVTSLVPEVLAYPWYALCSWLIVRALAWRRRTDIALAVAASLCAILVRAPQLGTVAAGFLLAAAGLWLTGPRGRALRAGWTRSDTLGAVVLFIGAFLLFNRVVLYEIEVWQLSTEYWKDRMFDLGLRAALAFTVGMGILPVLAGLASLRLPERRGDPVYRAFAAHLAATIVCLGLYTSVKAAHLSTIFSTLTEERNLIYLSPLMLIGTAMVLQARRIDWRIVTAATVFVVYLVLEKQIEYLIYPYYEAPGFAILALANRNLGWGLGELQVALLVGLAVSVLLLAARRAAGVPQVAAVLVVAVMLTSEIATTAGTVDLANKFRRNLPAQLDWIDRKTNRAPTTFIGQAYGDTNGLWLTEFWNRSITRVQSLDGTAPGPGPTQSPDLVDVNGTLTKTYDTPYVVTDNGVALQAEKIDSWKQLTLYRVEGPWRLRDALQQVYADGWAPEWSTYSYFSPNERGELVVTLSRGGYKGDAPPGRARLVVGTVRIGGGGNPELGRRLAVKRTLVRNGETVVTTIPIARTPVRVEVFITPTFQTGSDPRNLGAQVAFEFRPAGPA